jgi:hypothetical protein
MVYLARYFGTERILVSSLLDENLENSVALQGPFIYVLTGG